MIKKSKLVLLVLLALAINIFTVAPALAEQGKIKTLSVTPDILKMDIGDTVQLKVLAKYAGGLNDQDVTMEAMYKSSNINSVVVDENGFVKRVGKGRATVTIQYNGKKKIITVSTPGLVSKPYYGMVVSKTKLPDDYRLEMIVEGELKNFETDSPAVTALSGSNRGKEMNTIAAVAAGDIVAFNLKGGKIDKLTELNQGFYEPNSAEKGAIYVITEMNSGKKVLKLKNLGFNDSEKTVFLSAMKDSDEKAYLFDYKDTSRDPRLISIGDLDIDDHVQIFWFDHATNKEQYSRLIQFVKIVDRDWINPD